MPPFLHALHVCDLIDPNSFAWDLGLFIEHFDDKDVRLISSIPLLNCGIDRIIWHFTKSGIYSVKSRYHIACKLLSNLNALSIPDSRGWIWELNVPFKVRNFLLRVFRGCLPHREALHFKGI